LSNDLADFFQPSMRMGMVVLVIPLVGVAMRRIRTVLMRMGVTMRFSMRMGVPVSMRMSVRLLVAAWIYMKMLVLTFLRSARLLRPKLLARQLLFSSGDHIHLGRANAAPVHAGDLEPRVHPESLDRLAEELRRNSGVDQRAEKHVAADPGEAFKVGYTHQTPTTHHRYSGWPRQTGLTLMALL
jgi:hypothetical protein